MKLAIAQSRLLVRAYLASDFLVLGIDVFVRKRDAVVLRL
jgi:hypothetical protein